MNKFFKTVFCAATGTYVAVSEVAKGRGKTSVKSSVRKGLAVLAATGASVATGYAQTMSLPSIDPYACDGAACATTVSGGDNVTLTGLGTQIQAGSTGAGGGQMTYGTMLANGLIVSDSLNAITTPYMTITTGTKALTVQYWDPVTHSYLTTSVYNNANFSDSAMGTYANNYQTMPSPVNGGQYIAPTLGQVDSTGGTLNVNIGNGAPGTSVAANTIGMSSKQATLFTADGTGSANSAIIWNSNNLVNLSIAAAVPTGTKTINGIYSSTYTGTFTGFDGNSYTVNNAAQLQAYNSVLIAALYNGDLLPAAYATEFGKAYTTVSGSIVYSNTVVPSTDEVNTPIGNQTVMLANGAKASAKVAAGVVLDVQGANVLVATNGGLVTNEGTVSETKYTGTTGPVVMQAQGNGSRAINAATGVVNAGFLDGGLGHPATTGGSQSVSGMLATGTGAIVQNDGIVNYASGSGAVGGVGVQNGASGTNNGVVNVIPYPVSIAGVTVVDPGSTFLNSATGQINVGVNPTYTLGQAATPTAMSGGIGVSVKGQGSFTNDGTITLSSLEQGGTGINAISSGSIVNNGHVVLANNSSLTSPATSYGIYALYNTTTNVVNTANGIIDLNGINGRGIFASNSARVQDAGTINVNGGLTADGLRNYGIWSETSANVMLTGAVKLTGDGAIGVHARTGGTVAVSGAGAVNFLSGTNQIGYFMYGAGSNITNSSTGAQNVTTQGSTLYRVEDGANFTGTSAASSTLTASGQKSTAVVMSGTSGGASGSYGTGTASAFNSGGMTINLAGAGATGVVIEGGAQGKITTSSVINMNDPAAVGAVAGIADGQKHDLLGAVVGAPITGTLNNATVNAGAASFGTGTILVSGATLNSNVDGVTGYIARNGAEMSNSGNIIFTGVDSTGLRVEAGSRGDNTGSITMGGGGTAIVAVDPTGSKTTVVNNSGDLVLNGGSTANRTTGINASGAKTTVNLTGNVIALNGTGSIGVDASNGATVNVSGSSTPTFSASSTDQIMFHVSQAGTKIISSLPATTVLDASSTRSTVYRLDDGAAMSGTVNLAASGANARAIDANGSGTNVSVASGSQINVSGAGANGVHVAGNAQAAIANGATINLTNAGAIAGVVDGNTYGLDGSTTSTTPGTPASTLTNASTLTSIASGVVGFVAQNLGLLNNSGAVTLSGANSTGVKVLSAQLTNTGNVTVDGTAVYVEGGNSTVKNTGGTILATDGRAAIELGQDANLNLVGSGVNTVEGKGSAHAILIDQGAAGLTVNGAHLVVNAAGATGNGIENAGEISGIHLTSTTIDVAGGAGVRSAATLASTNDGQINVAGSGTGILFEKADGTASANNLDLSGSQALIITVSGAGGKGIVADTTGTVKTAATINVTNAAGGSALVIDSGVTSATNSGTLTSVSTAAPAVKVSSTGTFTNTSTGTISSTAAAGTAIRFDDNQDSDLINQGAITGKVNLGTGNNTMLNTGTITGDVIAGTGNNGLTVDGGSVTGNIALNGASGINSVLLKNAASINTFTGSSGNDTVTVQGSGNSFGQLTGGSGTATLVLDAASYTLASAAAVTNFDAVELTNSSMLTLQQLLSGKPAVAGTAAIDVDATSTLAVATIAAAPYTLANKLTGSGLVTVNTQGDAFNFSSTTGSAFTGTVALNSSTFGLTGANTSTLTNAMLKANVGSVTTVGDGEQKIDGLNINGGTLKFNATVPDEVLAASFITTNTLDVSHAGTVQIVLPQPYIAPAPNTLNTVNLLSQDEGNILTKLVNAASTTGTAGAITLADQNGAAMPGPQVLDIAQGGSTVAKGTYGFRLTTSPGDGLYVNYGLTQLDLQTGKTLTLAQNTGATGAAADMSAKIIGAGNLAIDAGVGLVSLSNTTNSYQGQTSVLTGTLRADADNALGQTSMLNIANAAATDINGTTQTIGALAGATGSTLDLNGGTLNITNGGTSAGEMTGSGQLNLNGGTLVVSGANAGLTASSLIANGALAVLNDVAGLGSGAITAAGTLQLKNASGDFSNVVSGTGTVSLTNGSTVAAKGDNSSFSGLFSLDAGTRLAVADSKNLGTAGVSNSGTLEVTAASDWTLANTVAGTGNLIKLGAGTLTAGNGLNYTGKTSVQQGMVLVGTQANPGVTLGGVGADTVTVNAGATLAGLGTVNGQVINNGTVSALGALAGNEALPAGTFTLNNGLLNNGLVALAGGSIGNTLLVKGNYVGNNGLITLQTYMGDDTSASDKLVVDGGRASGSTGLVIKHGGGSGAQTNQGIRVVETRNGATTDAGAFALSSTSDGYRAGVGTIASGAYDYRLLRGGKGGNAQDWYLASASNSTPTPDDNPSSDPTPASNTGGDPVTPTPQYRPEVGAYLNNKFAATAMQYHTLRDRQGQAPGGGDGLTTDDKSGWLRMVGSQDGRNGAGSTQDRSNTFLMHGGTDVWRSNVGKEGTIRTGVMATYGVNNSTSRSNGLNASGKVEGYNLGLYGTWYGNADVLSGPYVDTWAMMGKFNNTVKGQGLAKETYGSKAATASVETGYSFKVYDNGVRKLYVQPQVQAIVSRFNADNHVENNGTNVTGQRQNSVTTRVGVRLQGDIDNDHGLKQMRPFVEANLWHGPSSQRIAFDNDQVNERLPANRYEIKAGLQGNVSKSVSVYGSLGLQTGANNYGSATGQIGVKFAW